MYKLIELDGKETMFEKISDVVTYTHLPRNRCYLLCERTIIADVFNTTVDGYRLYEVLSPDDELANYIADVFHLTLNKSNIKSMQSWEWNFIKERLAKTSKYKPEDVVHLMRSLKVPEYIIDDDGSEEGGI